MKHGRDVVSLGLLVASGAAGLAYEIVWTQQCAFWLGHEAVAVLAVAAAFFAGIALGAAWLGRRIEASRRPALAYAGCEAAIGVWAALLIAAMAPVGDALRTLIGERPSPWRQWAIAFGGSFLLLLPATVAMGATLPAIARLVAALHDGRRAIAACYAANTFGACLGVLGAALWLVPTVGLVRTAAIAVVLNAVCAAIAWSWRDRLRVDAAGATGDVSCIAADRRDVPPASLRRIVVCLFATGLLGIGYEVLAVRVLGQVAEDTVYTYAWLLAVYLVGTAAGAAWWAGRTATAAQRTAVSAGTDVERLLLALTAAMLAGGGAMWGAEALHLSVVAALGGGFAAAVAGEALLAVVVFVAPTVVMGALFSALSSRAAAAGLGVGLALGINTAGAALAPLAIGVLVAPAVGAKATLLALAVGYLALLPASCWRVRGGVSARPAQPLRDVDGPGARVAWGLALAVLAVAVGAPRLFFVDVPEGGRLVAFREGATGSVSVVADADDVLRLRIDNREQEGSSATLHVDARQAKLPVLLHGSARRALFLGLGTGVTASAAAADPALEVDAVELLADVAAESPRFTRSLDDGRPARRLAVVVADARRFVRATKRTYDVVVADNFHPARSGSGALYTVEHFAAVRDRLTAHGLFCQWLPLHQLDLATLRSIVASFRAVFPDAAAVLASNSLVTPVLGLVGRKDGTVFDFAATQRRIDAEGGSTSSVAAHAVGLDDAYAVLGSTVAGADALARGAGDAPLNGDDRPVVAYRAPRLVDARGEPPGDRLLALLRLLEPASPPPVVADAATQERLAAYRRARDRFLALGRGIVPSADPAAMLVRLREPLLELLRTSADFRPAYEPLLRLGVELARRGDRAGPGVLRELAALQPARVEAAEALRGLRPD